MDVSKKISNEKWLIDANAIIEATEYCVYGERRADEWWRIYAPIVIFQKETMTQAALITSLVQIALVTDANICITAKGNVLEKALKMADCKWMKDE